MVGAAPDLDAARGHATGRSVDGAERYAVETDLGVVTAGIDEDVPVVKERDRARALRGAAGVRGSRRVEPVAAVSRRKREGVVRNGPAFDLSGEVDDSQRIDVVAGRVAAKTVVLPAILEGRNLRNWRKRGEARIRVAARQRAAGGAGRRPRCRDRVRMRQRS